MQLVCGGGGVRGQLCAELALGDACASHLATIVSLAKNKTNKKMSGACARQMKINKHSPLHQQLRLARLKRGTPFGARPRRPLAKFGVQREQCTLVRSAQCVECMRMHLLRVCERVPIFGRRIDVLGEQLAAVGGTLRSRGRLLRATRLRIRKRK